LSCVEEWGQYVGCGWGSGRRRAPFLAAAADLTAATALTTAAARRKMGERRMEAGAGVGVATRPEAGLATPTGRSPAPPACLPPPP